MLQEDFIDSLFFVVRLLHRLLVEKVSRVVLGSDHVPHVPVREDLVNGLTVLLTSLYSRCAAATKRAPERPCKQKHELPRDMSPSHFRHRAVLCDVCKRRHPHVCLRYINICSLSPPILGRRSKFPAGVEGVWDTRPGQRNAPFKASAVLLCSSLICPQR
jgi:hypothetical protein